MIDMTALNESLKTLEDLEIIDGVKQKTDKDLLVKPWFPKRFTRRKRKMLREKLARSPIRMYYNIETKEYSVAFLGMLHK